MSCIFCKIINKEIPSKPVYEDNDVIVVPDIHPQAPVHLLIIPKKHVAEFLDMPDELLAKIFKTSKKMIKEQKIADYRLVNNGQGAALIQHFHLHILGRVDKERTL